MLASLSTDILHCLFLNLPVEDIVRADCCRNLHNAVQNAALWDSLMQRDFNHQCADARRHYCWLFYPFRHALRTYWKRSNLKYYGGLCTLSIEEDYLRFCEQEMPKTPHEPLRPLDLCLIRLTDENIITYEPGREMKFTKCKLNPQMNLVSDTSPEDDLDDYYKDREEDIVTFQRRLGLQDMRLAARRYKSRANLLRSGLQTFDPIEFSDSPSFFVNGLYKGTYGPHGVEMIHVTSDEFGRVTGTKISGDPNVPCGEITFVAYLDSPLHFTRAEQQSIEMLEHRTDVLELPDERTEPFVNNFWMNSPEPFYVPDHCNIDVDASTFPSHCLCRFAARAHVAFDNFQRDEFIPAQMIVFSDDLFAVLFLSLRSLSVYTKVKEIPVLI